MTVMPNVVSYWVRGIFAVGFIIAVTIIARILSAHGRRFLNHVFKSDQAIVDSVHILLNPGFYLLCIGLFLWNMGVLGNDYNQESIFVQVIENAAFRLGISIFVIGAFHSINILILATLNRKNS